MNQTAIQKTVFKVSDLVSWQRIGSLLLSPNFQRRPVWPKGAKSYLIDTVVRGIPIPIIFLRQRTDLETLEPKREVVDGQQRLRTLFTYIDPALLKNFIPDRDAFVVKRSHNKDLAGKTFKDLPASIKQVILDYEFSVHVLPSDTDDREILQIFARMNATGYKLNAQELRNAAWFGDFKSLAYELAYEQLSRWRKWRVFSETEIARMIEVEETSDLIALLLVGLHGKSNALLDKLYRQHDETFPQSAEVADRFRAVIDKIDDTLGGDLASLTFHRKALFSTLFSYYYDLMFGLGSELKHLKPKALPGGTADRVRAASDKIEQGNIPEDLAKVLRGATGDAGSRKTRLEFLRQTHAAKT